MWVCVTILDTDDDLNGNMSAWERFYFWHMYWRQVFTSKKCLWWLSFNVRHNFPFLLLPDTHPPTQYKATIIFFLLWYDSMCFTIHACPWLNSPLCVFCSSFAGGVRSVCRLLSRGSVKLRGFPPWVAIGISLCLAMGNGTFLCAGRV